MSMFDNIPIEHHGMSEWTLLVFIFVSIAGTILIKLLMMWKEAHDNHMSEQVKRIDAHDQQLNSVSLDIIEIKTDGKHVKESLQRIEEPLNDMRDITKTAIAKVLEVDD